MTTRKRPSLLEDDDLQHVDSDDSDAESDGDVCVGCGDLRSDHPTKTCEKFEEDQ